MLKLPKELVELVPCNIKDPVRIGCASDGGYIIPQKIIDLCDNLLSCGLGDNWSFDQHWKRIKPTSKIHMYDGTVSLDTLKDYLRAPYSKFFPSQAIHFQENVGKKIHNPDHTEFSTMLERLGDGSVFLKMDIEGGEYQLLDDIIAHKHRIPGIALELHFLNYRRPHFLTALSYLKEHYALVHTHGNNHTVLGADGVCDCLEFTFVRRDLVDPTELRYNFYINDLDVSNVPGIDDYVFYYDEHDTGPTILTFTVNPVTGRLG